MVIAKGDRQDPDSQEHQTFLTYKYKSAFEFFFGKETECIRCT